MGLTFTNDSATISTSEYSLPADTSTSVPTSQTTTGLFQFFVDLGALTSTEQYRFKLYEKTDSGATQRVVEEWIFTGAQSKPMWVSPAFMLGAGWDFTGIKISGTDRSIGWSIRRVI